jgi:hypothetical protein
MSRTFKSAVIGCALALAGMSDLARAQIAGTIEGIARIAGSNAPMAFALVRVLGADSATLASEITNAEGRFRFASVNARDVRLRILRIGFRPTTTPVLHLEADRGLRYDLLSEPLPIQLPAVAVHAVAGCLDATTLSSDSALFTLWTEARKGVEIRRAFELRYRFTRALRQEAQIHWRLRPDARQARADTLISDPDSIPARDARARADHATAGYAKGNRLIVPDEKELLDETFLQANCLEPSIPRANGALGVSFHPKSAKPAGYAIRGTIWLDASTYAIQRIDYEHLDDGNAFSRTNIAYAPVRVGESSLSLPAGGKVTLQPRGPGHFLASGVTATLLYSYSGFQEMPPR